VDFPPNLTGPIRKIEASITKTLLEEKRFMGEGNGKER
jgi:hypothetical protein